MFPGSFREEREVETAITPRGISYATPPSRRVALRMPRLAFNEPMALRRDEVVSLNTTWPTLLKRK